MTPTPGVLRAVERGEEQAGGENGGGEAGGFLNQWLQEAAEEGLFGGGTQGRGEESDQRGG